MNIAYTPCYSSLERSQGRCHPPIGGHGGHIPLRVGLGLNVALCIIRQSSRQLLLRRGEPATEVKKWVWMVA
jgi:hypothetical protein